MVVERPRTPSELTGLERADEMEAIHTWFSLTYANYLVLPRSVLQSMPDEWQQRFVGTLNELDEAFGHLADPSYEVRVYRREPEMITPQIDCEECDGTGTKGDEDCKYCGSLGTVDDPEGDRYETAEEVGFMTDPVPHYNRGRTRLEPRIA